MHSFKKWNIYFKDTLMYFLLTLFEIYSVNWYQKFYAYCLQLSFLHSLVYIGKEFKVI